MIKDLLERLDYSIFANISLVLFVLIFLAVCLRALLTHRDTLAQHASIVLDENHKEPQ